MSKADLIFKTFIYEDRISDFSPTEYSKFNEIFRSCSTDAMFSKLTQNMVFNLYSYKPMPVRSEALRKFLIASDKIESVCNHCTEE